MEEHPMMIGLKCNQELLQQLIAVQAIMRSPSKSDTLRRLIQDAHEKFFADKLTGNSKESK